MFGVYFFGAPHAVDGRNPAPVDRYFLRNPVICRVLCIPGGAGFFHQRYVDCWDGRQQQILYRIFGFGHLIYLDVQLRDMVIPGYPDETLAFGVANSTGRKSEKKT